MTRIRRLPPEPRLGNLIIIFNSTIWNADSLVKRGIHKIELWAYRRMLSTNEEVLFQKNKERELINLIVLPWSCLEQQS